MNNNYQRFELNIINEPKTLDGGIIVSRYGDLLLEISYNEPFYVKINDITITSINNKVIFNNGVTTNNDIAVYNIDIHNNIYTPLIAVFKTKKEHAIINNYIVYN